MMYSFCMENDYRNIFLIYLLTIIGASIRYVFFNLIFLLLGKKRKPIAHFTTGFNQIVSNLLLTFMIFIGFFFLLLYLFTYGYL